LGGRRPNIKRFSANPGRRWDYVGKHAGKKEGHFIVGDQCERPSEGDLDTRSQSDIWSEIIGSTTKEEFWSRLTTLAPKQLGCNFGSLKLYVDWKYKPDQEVYETPRGEFDVPAVLEHWADLYIRDEYSGRLVLPVTAGVPPLRTVGSRWRSEGDPPPAVRGRLFGSQLWTLLTYV